MVDWRETLNTGASLSSFTKASSSNLFLPPAAISDIPFTAVFVGLLFDAMVEELVYDDISVFLLSYDKLEEEVDGWNSPLPLLPIPVSKQVSRWVMSELLSK